MQSAAFRWGLCFPVNVWKTLQKSSLKVDCSYGAAGSSRQRRHEEAWGKAYIHFSAIFRPICGFYMAFAKHARTTNATLLTSFLAGFILHLPKRFVYRTWILTIFIKHFYRCHMRIWDFFPPFQHFHFLFGPSAVHPREKPYFAPEWRIVVCWRFWRLNGDEMEKIRRSMHKTHN